MSSTSNHDCHDGRENASANDASVEPSAIELGGIVDGANLREKMIAAYKASQAAKEEIIDADKAALDEEYIPQYKLTLGKNRFSTASRYEAVLIDKGQRLSIRPVSDDTPREENSQVSYVDHMIVPNKATDGQTKDLYRMIDGQPIVWCDLSDEAVSEALELDDESFMQKNEQRLQEPSHSPTPLRQGFIPTPRGH